MMKKVNHFSIALITIFTFLWAALHLENMQFSRILILLTLFPILCIPKILRKQFSLPIDEKTEFFYIFYIFCAQVLGCILRFYQTVIYYDKFMHFLSGILSCFFALSLLKYFKLEKTDKKFQVLFLLFTTLSIALLWEIFEYTSDTILLGDVQNVKTTGVKDTMQDMIMAFLASCGFAFFYFRFHKR